MGEEILFDAQTDEAEKEKDDEGIEDEQETKQVKADTNMNITELRTTETDKNINIKNITTPRKDNIEQLSDKLKLVEDCLQEKLPTKLKMKYMKEDMMKKDTMAVLDGNE